MKAQVEIPIHQRGGRTVSKRGPKDSAIIQRIERNDPWRRGRPAKRLPQRLDNEPIGTQARVYLGSKIG